MLSSVLAARRIGVAFERGRCRAEQHDAFLELCPNDGDIASVVARRLLLFIGSLVFFIDHDQSEIYERRENGAAGADDDARPARMHLVPFIVPLAFRQMAVQDGAPCPAARRSGS